MSPRHITCPPHSSATPPHHIHPPHYPSAFPLHISRRRRAHGLSCQQLSVHISSAADGMRLPRCSLPKEVHDGAARPGGRGGGAGQATAGRGNGRASLSRVLHCFRSQPNSDMLTHPAPGAGLRFQRRGAGVFGQRRAGGEDCDRKKTFDILSSSVSLQHSSIFAES